MIYTDADDASFYWEALWDQYPAVVGQYLEEVPGCITLKEALKWSAVQMEAMPEKVLAEDGLRHCRRRNKP